MAYLFIVILLFAGLFYLLFIAHTKQARTDYRRRQAAHQLALRMTPQYRMMQEQDRAFQLAQERQAHELALQRQEFELKRTLALQWREVAQYGLLKVNQDTGELVHIAPIHKPLPMKAIEDQDAALAIPGTCTFSQVLATFRPTSERILLGYLPGETEAVASAEGLCHVALAGATGGGKSVLVRLLMSQLCFVGADVLLLNPHYTRYDLRSNEDWTPFEPYLFDDPMRCRQYAVIGDYLRHVAQELLPTRLERYARSLPTGKPFYLVLDELPAIVKHVPEAPGYMADLLREGRKVGLFLVTAAQDFLVKTIMKDEGGAVRDCFRTAVYVGGDPTTARTLLDVKGAVDDGGLGKGVVMLRSAQVKQAQFARVPYVDNESLYQLLGPSTYVPANRRPDVHETPETPAYERPEQDFSERPDARIVESDITEIDDSEGQPENVRTFPQSDRAAPGEPTHSTSDERLQYTLTESEIDQFKAAYRASGNIDRALAAIGKGSKYRECARRIIQVYALRKEEA